jgi:hypothetical protein
VTRPRYLFADPPKQAAIPQSAAAVEQPAPEAAQPPVAASVVPASARPKNKREWRAAKKKAKGKAGKA